MNVPILAYHKVSDRFEWGINNVRIKSFLQQIKFLHENRFYTITIQNYLDGNFEKNQKWHPVLITFDDGDESVFINAFPVLKKYNYTATVFVISDFVGKNNTWDANLFGICTRHLNWHQICLLKKAGWEIGSHSATHPDLTRLDKDSLFEELCQSKKIISEKIDNEVISISYPFNRFNNFVLTAVEKCAYKAGFVLAHYKKNKAKFKHLTIPRYGVYLIDNQFSFRQKLKLSRLEFVKQRVISFFSAGTIWYNCLKSKKFY